MRAKIVQPTSTIHKEIHMEEKKVSRASFSLEEEYRDLLQEIATMERRSMTDEMRLMIDRKAEELGLKPVAPTRRGQ